MERPTMGTSIADLHNSKESNEHYDSIRKLQANNMNSYNANQGLQMEQGHNAETQMHQAQHYPYYESTNLTKFPMMNKTNQRPISNPNIEEITRDINEGMNMDFSTDNDFIDSIIPDQKGLSEMIPKCMWDPLLVLVIYIILSQSAVRNFFGKYISQLNADYEGNVSFSGILIYGIILVVIYAIVKKLLFGNMVY